MATRMKKVQTEQRADPDEGSSAPVEPGVDAISSSGERFEELAGLVKSLAKTQAAREKTLEKEAAKHELRWKSMQHQIQEVQSLVNQAVQRRADYDPDLDPAIN
ncbi:unnamed protein product [Knipowitschia caucasica]